MSGHLYGSAENDRAMQAFDAWLTHDPREDATEEDLTAAEAADQLAAVEDAGGVLYEPSPGEFRVAAGEAFYPEALGVVARASAHLGPSRQRSLTDGTLGAILHSGREGAAPAARALRRLAEETGDTAVAGLATRVASLHAAMVLALPADVRAPLDAEIGARP